MMTNISPGAIKPLFYEATFHFIIRYEAAAFFERPLLQSVQAA